MRIRGGAIVDDTSRGRHRGLVRLAVPDRRPE
jgi:hypothetical protein